MVNIALIFPGQGAQKAGMGKEFYDSSPQAKAAFDSADKILGNGLLDVIFNGPQEKLTSTAYCQPAILAFSIAALNAFKSHPKFKMVTPKFAAGLSLGEYSALVAGGALSFEDALRLVERRSAFMEEAARLAKGAMAAIIGFDKKRLLEICQATGAEVANFNSPEQIVITGDADKVYAASEMIRREGAQGVIPLDVSGAFHSTLMKPAAEKFTAELKKVQLQAPRFPVVCNVDGNPQSNPLQLSLNLARQMTASVCWEQSVQYMARQGISHFMEIGPGKVLKGLLRRIDPGLKVCNIEKPADIDEISL